MTEERDLAAARREGLHYVDVPTVPLTDEQMTALSYSHVLPWVYRAANLELPLYHSDRLYGLDRTGEYAPRDRRGARVVMVLSAVYWAIVEAIAQVGPEWRISAGGTWPKRLAYRLRDALGQIDCTSLVAQLGAHVGQICAQRSRVFFRLDHDFEWAQGDYGDSGSCFFTCRNGARAALRQSGRFVAFCFYKYDATRDAFRPYGRLLAVQPYDGAPWVLWNSYGQDLLHATRYISHFLSMSYVKVRLENCGTQSGTIWINGGRGYALIPFGTSPDRVADSFDLGIDTEAKCDDCRYTFDDCQCGAAREECGNCGSADCEQCPNCDEQECECGRCECGDTRCECGTCEHCDNPRCECSTCPECDTAACLQCARCNRCHECGHQL